MPGAVAFGRVVGLLTTFTITAPFVLAAEQATEGTAPGLKNCPPSASGTLVRLVDVAPIIRLIPDSGVLLNELGTKVLLVGTKSQRLILVAAAPPSDRK